MGDILRKAVENRRKRLINQLLLSGALSAEDEPLLGLSLTELENEYKRLKNTRHHQQLQDTKWKANFDRSDI